jgi:hypothetical protein
MEVAELLGRHKNWVCRRLALLEKLSAEAREDLRLGLLSPYAARRESLSTEELRGVVDLLLTSASRQKEEYVLAKPREALRQAQGVAPPSWDPRLSSAGNRIAKQLGLLLDRLGRMENWLHTRGRGELTACDRGPLAPGFSRLSREARRVAELADDFLLELTLDAPPRLRRSEPRKRQRRVKGEGAMNELTRNEIIRRHQGGASLRALARAFRMARRTVRRVLEQQEQDRILENQEQLFGR